ncbi:MAG: electron transport complex subunit RsxC [Dethiobacteraceae bacterium]|jgi:electron transport complex protein RnfC
MSPKTFKGGIHPGDFKNLTEKKPVVPAKPPAVAVIPLSQHIGAPCKPLVAVGDEVKMGQKIGDSDASISAPVHASVSGKVIKIGTCKSNQGHLVNAVFIENDFQDTWHESVKPNPDWEQLPAEAIPKIVREAGVVGMGGAAFPCHYKLVPPDKIEFVVVNGAECEPYLTCDHRLMLERPEDLIVGVKLVMKAVNARKGLIGIEDNKPDAIEAVRKAAANDPDIEVHALPTKYPQGSGKQLVSVLTGRETPSGCQSTTVGCLVQNVGTCVAVADAVRFGLPSIERIVTITGAGVKEPKNMLVRVGTPLTQVIEECGGFTADLRKLIMGGPMMGPTMSGPEDIPIVKGTCGILCLTEQEVQLDEIGPCIKCGKCVEVCPMGLMPLFLASAVEQRLYDIAETYHAVDCIDCGCCTYICPAKRPLNQWIGMAKNEIKAKQRRAAAAK